MSQSLSIVRRDALAFLQGNSTAVIATAVAGEPHASTVYYAIDTDFNLYFVTKRNTGKYIQVARNEAVAFVIGTGPEHISVQGRGHAEILFGEQKERALALVADVRAREHVKTWPIKEITTFKDKADVVFKIIPSQLSFMNLDSTQYPESISKEYVSVLG